MPALSTIERAFQLARSNECQTIDDVRGLLTREGYTDALAQTGFPFVRKQLQDILQGRPPSAPRKIERRRKRGLLRLSV